MGRLTGPVSLLFLSYGGPGVQHKHSVHYHACGLLSLFWRNRISGALPALRPRLAMEVGRGKAEVGVRE